MTEEEFEEFIEEAAHAVYKLLPEQFAGKMNTEDRVHLLERINVALTEAMKKIMPVQDD